MQKRPPGFQKPQRLNSRNSPGSDGAITVLELARRIPEFIYECEYRGHSPRTLEEERAVLHKALRFFQESGFEYCGGSEIRQYLKLVAEGGLQRGGRWGNQTAQRPVRPRAVRNHWGYLRTFFNWLQEEDPNFASPFWSAPHKSKQMRD